MTQLRKNAEMETLQKVQRRALLCQDGVVDLPIMAAMLPDTVENMQGSSSQPLVVSVH